MSIQASKKISLIVDKGGKIDKMSITKASVKNIEERIISARVIGLIKAFVDVLLFFNLPILTGDVGSNLHKNIRIYT